MTFTLSLATCIELTGGRTTATTGSALGVARSPDEVRGGELFVGQSGASEAAARGAGIVLTTPDAAPESASAPHGEAAIVLVQRLDQALESLARWWRGKISARVMVLSGAPWSAAPREAIAHLLLPIANGAYGASGDPYVDVLRIGQSHEWALLELPAYPTAALLALLAPQLLVHCPPPFRTVAAPVQTEAPSSIVPFADAGALSALREVYTYGDEEGASVRALIVERRGLRGLALEIHSSEQRHQLVVPYPGEGFAALAAMAVAVQRWFAPHRALEKSSRTLMVPSEQQRLLPTTDGRLVIDYSQLTAHDAASYLLNVAREIVTSPLPVDNTDGEDPDDQDGAPRFPALALILAQELLAAESVRLALRSLSLTALIVVVPHGASMTAGPYEELRVQGPVFQAESLLAAFHIVNKLPFEVVMVLGGASSPSCHPPDEAAR